MSEQKIANLNEEQVSKIKNAEEKLGVCLVAYEKKVSYATLGDEELKKIQDLERELGCILIAYS